MLQGIPITDQGWSFPKNTFIYGKWVNDLDVSVLKEIYKIEHVDYEVVGKLSEKIYQELLECLSKDRSLNRMYQRMIGSWI